MDLLQTPNMPSPGFSSVFLGPSLEDIVISIDQFFYISFHSSVIQMFHFMFLSDISCLVKLGVSPLVSNPKKISAFQFL